MADKPVLDSVCKERTNVIIEKIKEIKDNDLPHTNAKIDCLDKKLSDFKDSITSKINYIIIIGLLLSLLAGINVAKILIDLAKTGTI